MRTSGDAQCRRGLVALVASAAGLCAWVSAAQPTRLDIYGLLDQYANGGRDGAVEAVANAGPPLARAWRAALVSTGHAWVHRAPEDLPRRILNAAAFALEFETVRAEKGEWGAMGPDACAGRCAVEWACTILRARGDADEAERLWHHATFALAGGVRDWTFLLTPLTAPTPRTRLSGHVLHALSRLPGDPRARLAQAIAIASRHMVADEMDAPRMGERSAAASAMIIRPPVNAELIASRLQQSMDYARQQFTGLIDHGVVGPEARMRLGYLYFRSNLYEPAITAEREAAEATPDPDLKYVSYSIAAQAAQALGALVDAEDFYGKALEARPGSQSATIALAALQFLRGDASAAYDAIERSRAERPHDDDPWRMFLYGSYPQLPGLIAQLRTTLTP
jgi:tetratricopeptide (TPR) repeat protein